MRTIREYLYSESVYTLCRSQILVLYSIRVLYKALKAGIHFSDHPLWSHSMKLSEDWDYVLTFS